MSEVNTVETREDRTVVGMLDQVDQAENAINDLKLAGFSPEAISVVTRTKPATEVADTDVTEDNEAGQGALAGAIGGGTLGAVLGWLLAGGTALIPGVGPVIAAGIFAATISGALLGGTLGGVSGALVGQGVPKEDAEEYESYMKDGRTLVTVHPASGQQVEATYDIFDRNGATMVRRYIMNMAGARRAAATTDEATVPTQVVDDYSNSATYQDEYLPDGTRREPRSNPDNDRDNLPPTAMA